MGLGLDGEGEEEEGEEGRRRGELGGGERSWRWPTRWGEEEEGRGGSVRAGLGHEWEVGEGCGERKRGRKERREESGKRSRDPKEKVKGSFARWEDPFAKKRKGRRVAARCRGWERKTARAGIRVLEARWAWAGLGYSLALEKHFYFRFLLQKNLAINF